MFVKKYLLGLNSLSVGSVRRRQNHPSHDRDSLESWYLSGVGRDIGWDGHAPPSGHDVRVDGGGLDGDFVVAYTNRYFLQHFVSFSAGNVFTGFYSLRTKIDGLPISFVN